MIKKIPIQGMSRMLPQSTSEDGLCRDIINLRMYNGAWRPIGSPTQFATGAENNMPSFIHQATDGSDFLITYDTSTGYLKYKPLTYGSYISLQTIGVGKTVRFSSLHNVLLMINETDKIAYYALYDLTELTYRWIGSEIFPDTIRMIFSTPSTATYSDELSFDSSGMSDEDKESTILGNLLKQEAKLNTEGYFTGDVAIIWAFELFDGSIVKHSYPYYITSGQWQWKIVGNTIHTRILKDDLYYNILPPTLESTDLMFTVGSTIFKLGTMDDGNLHLYYSATTEIIRTWDQYPGYVSSPSAGIATIQQTFSGLVKNVSIYMTRPLNPYQMDLTDLSGAYDEVTRKEQLSLDKEAVERNYRLIHKVSIDKLAYSVPTKIELDNLTGFDGKEPLPVDNSTHHRLYSQCDYRYNNRIFHGDITMTMYKGYPLGSLCTHTSSSRDPYKAWFEVDIASIDGVKTVRSEINTFTFGTNAGGLQFRMNEHFSYPDARASALRIYISLNEIDVYLIRTLTLSSSTLQNFAYYIFDLTVNEEWFLEAELVPLTPEAYAYTSLPALNSIILNPNRVQASEVDNPFCFPAKNSYNVGHSRIAGLGANTLLIESGQFGEYPIYTFTQDGVWAMNFSADASILIDSVKPATMDVCTNRDSITSTPYGVVFVTEDMLMIISGMRSVKISSEMEGDYISPLIDCIGYANIISNPYTADVGAFIDDANFQSYLQDSIINYNYKKEEIIVSNLNYSYSFVYNVLQKFWHKIGNSYNQVLTFNQKVIGEKNGILFDLTEETWGDDGVPTFLETYPLKLTIDTYKKIEALALRGMLDCDPMAGAGLYLFASVDGFKWFHILSREMVGQLRDIVSKRAPYSACQFVICFSGTLKETSYLTHFDIQYKERFANKIR